MVLKKEEKGIASWLKRYKRLLLYALLPIIVFVGWRSFNLFPQTSLIYMKVSMTATANSTAQVFYDTGEGLSEEASTRVAVGISNRFREYRFRLPREAIHYLRFDPLISGGTVSIKDMAIIDGLGRTILPVDLQWVQPGQQIKSLKNIDGVLFIAMERDANDPQLVVAFPAQFRPGWVSILSVLHIGVRILVESAILYGFAVIFFLGVKWLLGSSLAVNLRGKIPSALILAIFVICVFEGIQHKSLPAKIFYHEVDGLLFRLGHALFDSDAVILGNSVAFQVFGHPSYLESEQRRNVAMLATNEAIGLTGQYFIMKRYLERNRLPRAVILLTKPYMEGSLSYETVDNYICRTFTRPGEILDVLLLKRDPVFSLKTVAYGFFPSFKYRLRLQKDWLGFTNAPIYTGAAHTGRSEKNKIYSITQILKRVISQNDIPERHFVKLLDLLKTKSIPLHFVTPPIKDENSDLILMYSQAYERYFPALKKDHSLFHWSQRMIRYPDHFFDDDMHFSKEGLPLARSYLYGIVDEVVRVETAKLCEAP